MEGAAYKEIARRALLQTAAAMSESVSPSPSALAPPKQQDVCWPFATSPRQICTLELKVIFIRTYINVCCVGEHICPRVLAKGGGEAEDGMFFLLAPYSLLMFLAQEIC